jgi:hypothetical protein
MCAFVVALLCLAGALRYPEPCCSGNFLFLILALRAGRVNTLKFRLAVLWLLCLSVLCNPPQET